MLVTTVKLNEHKRVLLLPDAAQSSLLSVAEEKTQPGLSE